MRPSIDPLDRHWLPGTSDLWQSATLRRLLRAAACFSATLICIMKSNRNAFCVNSGWIAYDRKFINTDTNEMKTNFFATASQISHTSRFIRCLFLKKSRLAFFNSRKSISLIEFTTFILIKKCLIIVKRWEWPFSTGRKLPVAIVCPA